MLTKKKLEKLKKDLTEFKDRTTDMKCSCEAKSALLPEGGGND